MSNDLPSGKRIWELAEQAIQIESEWYPRMYFNKANAVLASLYLVEKRSFETLLGPAYEETKQEHEISRQEFGPSGPDASYVKPVPFLERMAQEKEFRAAQEKEARKATEFVNEP